MLAVENPIKEEPIIAKASTIAQPILEKTLPTRSFLSIPKEHVVSVKDFVTSGLPAHGPMEGMEASGSDGCPAMPQFKFTWGHATKDVRTDDVGKTAIVVPK